MNGMVTKKKSLQALVHQQTEHPLGGSAKTLVSLIQACVLKLPCLIIVPWSPDPRAQTSVLLQTERERLWQRRLCVSYFFSLFFFFFGFGGRFFFWVWVLIRSAWLPQSMAARRRRLSTTTTATRPSDVPGNRCVSNSLQSVSIDSYNIYFTGRWKSSVQPLDSRLDLCWKLWKLLK